MRPWGSASPSARTIERIVVPLDGSRTAEVALPHAAAIAKVFGARVYLLGVTEPSPSGRMGTDSVEWRLACAETRAYLEGLAERLDVLGVAFEWATAEGRASEQILRFIDEKRADLVVLSSHGRGGITEFNLSGTASKVARSTNASILIVRARAAGTSGGFASYDRVLAPVDCTKRSEWSVHVAGAIARAVHAELVLATVIVRPEVLGRGSLEATALVKGLVGLNRDTAQKQLMQLAESVTDDDLIVREHVVEADHVEHALEQLADEEDCSLIVVSAHGGRPDTGRPFGSIPALLLEHSTKPVLVLQDVAWKRQEHASESAAEAVGSLPSSWA